jgi:hypothetical protein
MRHKWPRGGGNKRPHAKHNGFSIRSIPNDRLMMEKRREENSRIELQKIQKKIDRFTEYTIDESLKEIILRSLNIRKLELLQSSLMRRIRFDLGAENGKSVDV